MSEMEKLKEEFKKLCDTTDSPTAKAGFAIATSLMCLAEQLEIRKALDSVQLFSSNPDTMKKYGGLYEYGRKIFEKFGIKPKEN